MQNNFAICKIKAENLGASVNKQDLINQIVKNVPELSKNKAASAVTTIFAIISEALSQGDRVTLSGFGTFYVGERQKKKGTNPRTKEPIIIPASVVPKFRPAAELKKAVK